jgi:hypothetical protein
MPRHKVDSTDMSIPWKVWNRKVDFNDYNYTISLQGQKWYALRPNSEYPANPVDNKSKLVLYMKQGLSIFLKIAFYMNIQTIM